MTHFDGLPVEFIAEATDRFRAAVQVAKIGPNGDIPHVLAPIIIKFTDLQTLELL